MFEAVRRVTDSIFGHTRRDPKDKHRPNSRLPRQLESHTKANSSLAKQPCLLAPKLVHPSWEIDAEIERLKGQLKELEASIEREQEFSRRARTRSNHGLIDAMNKRALWLQNRITKLASSPTASRMANAKPVPTATRQSTANTKAVQENPDDRIIRVARKTLKRTRFAKATERAIFEKIAADLADGENDVQIHVLERLGELRSIKALPILSAAAHHHNEQVRVAAIRAVASMRDLLARGILIEALNDPNHRVRTWAVRGLHGLEDPSLADLLCQKLSDPHPQVRRAAVACIRWKRLHQAGRELALRLRDESSEVRAAAANALGQCGNESSVFRLLVTLADAESNVCRAAASSVEKILGVAIDFDPDASLEARGYAAQQLKSWWKKERVRRLTKSDDAAITEPLMPTEPVKEEPTKKEETVSELDEDPDELDSLDGEIGVFEEGKMTSE